ncbi:hypothetical protein B0H13DRAFT_1886144 [Mycena leptocephala]|nr:hypothetical protein B0H13DRAFT_1886144 [Mycena leptocephala]
MAIDQTSSTCTASYPGRSKTTSPRIPGLHTGSAPPLHSENYSEISDHPSHAPHASLTSDVVLRPLTMSSPSKPKKTKLIAQTFKCFQPTASSSSLLNSRTVSSNSSPSDVLDQLLLSSDPSHNYLQYCRYFRFTSIYVVSRFKYPTAAPDRFPDMHVVLVAEALGLCDPSRTHLLEHLRKALLTDHVTVYPVKDLFSDLDVLPKGTLITLALTHGLTVLDDATCNTLCNSIATHIGYARRKELKRLRAE